MVNFLELQKPLLYWLVRRAGLRQHTVELDPGTTVMTFWVPKAKATSKKKKKKKKIIINVDKSRKKMHEQEEEKPAVVLVHGFATDGIMTWQFQIGALADRYEVYVPDLLFFGGSTTDSKDRSPAFQADCVAAALGRLGVLRCTVVGFSYGGLVAFKLAERWPELVRYLVVSGSVHAMTDAITEETHKRIGVSSSSELLLPESVDGLKALLAAVTYKRLWIPDCVYRDFLEIMFKNRKEKAEMLEALVIRNQDVEVPYLPQKAIFLLWGENDNIFELGLAENMKEQLGEKVTLKTIKKAGHLAQLERPCVYNRCLKEFLAQVHAEGSKG